MFKVVDMHCDTIPVMFELMKSGKQVSIEKNNFQIDLEKLQKGNYLCQCFSLFTDLGQVEEEGETPFYHAMALAEYWKKEIGRFPDKIRQVCSYEEIMENQTKDRISAVMTVEEGGVYEGDIEKLYQFYDMGVRISTITWNFVNELGYPNPPYRTGNPWIPDTENGLTEKGIYFVEEMERLGILPDISHLNDAGIEDVFRYTSGPVAATHSNARTICGHLRNLSDDVIKKLANRGGVTGINFYPCFLRGPGEAGQKYRASAEDMVFHMKYLKNLGGIDCVALGTDFDGFDGETDIENAGSMQHLADMMSTEGFNDGEIEKVFYKNALRVFREVW